MAMAFLHLSVLIGINLDEFDYHMIEYRTSKLININN